MQKTQKQHPKYDRQFINKSISQTLQFLQSTIKGQNKVINFKLPEDLKAAVDLEIRDEPCNQEDLLGACKAMLEHQVKPYHPHFHNQLFGGFDQYAYIGAVMAPSINGSVFTYQISPCYTLMENAIYQHMRKIVGWQTIDATMTPGGSFANFMGIHLSRTKLHPDFNKKGLYGYKPMKIFTSQVSHYSVKKGVNFCGLGTENIVSVKTDHAGRMIPSQLEKAIQLQISNGNDLLLVNTTIGTTVEGNIDPLTQIGEISQKYGVWHHADAAFGGAFMMSQQLIKKIGSFKNVDSITFDPHKGLVVPLQATLFMCKHKGLMHSCNSTNADYLFHKERVSYDSSLDVGDKTLQCGRVIDIIKLWTYLKGNGWKTVAKQVQSEHNLALFTKQYIKTHSDRFKLAIEQVQTFNVCFWYIPKKMQIQNFAKEEQYYNLISKATVLAKKYMIEQGKILIGYSKSKLPYYFWRTVLSNPFNTHEEITLELQLIAKYTQLAYQSLNK